MWKPKTDPGFLGEAGAEGDTRPSPPSPAWPRRSSASRLNPRDGHQEEKGREEGEAGEVEQEAGREEKKDEKRKGDEAAEVLRDTRERGEESVKEGETGRSGEAWVEAERDRIHVQSAREEKDDPVSNFPPRQDRNAFERGNRTDNAVSHPRCQAAAPRIDDGLLGDEKVRQAQALASLSSLGQEIFFAIRDVKDPEFPVYTLGDLGVTTPQMIRIENEDALLPERARGQNGEAKKEAGATEREEAACEREGRAQPGETPSEPSWSNGEKRGWTAARLRHPRREPAECSSNALSSSEKTAQTQPGESSFSSSFLGCERVNEAAVVTVGLAPTNAKCSMVSLIGLAVRCKLCARFPFISPNFLQRLHPEAGETDDAEEDWGIEGESDQSERNKGGNWDAVREEREGKERSISADVVSSGYGASWVSARARGSRKRVQRRLFVDLEIFAHEDAESLTKQLNDKERVCAALENPQIRELVLAAIEED
ncbi:conserved hypothetical protein [Neospora caninum Liverpool]|uniref:Uncharacterized protein n=1 Tax=Neospora caninum (strain Liverpool) TaxID=572307 RepID=F0V822_NEOCL|nr:conserved hypothetical protein [Neospora caninum Liverpool]CBZ49863.1 conserved hypothetical protein [Neospora caninum Liverpool]CEL64452.1 TPA: hypothetical protein BN1204_003480 [Neospora caninum Liverpool]|eukprot:XP_003879898.1 conserved hypothetical protein [Neospora caninum Liverpool]